MQRALEGPLEKILKARFLAFAEVRLPGLNLNRRAGRHHRRDLAAFWATWCWLGLAPVPADAVASLRVADLACSVSLIGLFILPDFALLFRIEISQFTRLSLVKSCFGNHGSQILGHYASADQLVNPPPRQVPALVAVLLKGGMYLPVIRDANSRLADMLHPSAGQISGARIAEVAEFRLVELRLLVELIRDAPMRAPSMRWRSADGSSKYRRHEQRYIPRRPSIVRNYIS
jgi:hypothetical protein